jgi:hypothetical protein
MFILKDFGVMSKGTPLPPLLTVTVWLWSPLEFVFREKIEPVVFPKTLPDPDEKF